MAAKDVLDLQVSVTSLEDAAREFDQPLGSLGFRRTPYERDHVPAGWPDDGRAWVKRLWTRRGHPGGDVNLHVRLAGSPNERLALLFRDWFRAHPEAVPAYASFKRSLAAAVPDIATYSDVKDPVVDLVIVAPTPGPQSAAGSPSETHGRPDRAGTATGLTGLPGHDKDLAAQRAICVAAASAATALPPAAVRPPGAGPSPGTAGGQAREYGQAGAGYRERVAIPLLEWLDRAGVTRRVADDRRTIR